MSCVIDGLSVTEILSMPSVGGGGGRTGKGRGRISTDDDDEIRNKQNEIRSADKGRNKWPVFFIKFSSLIVFVRMCRILPRVIHPLINVGGNL